MSRFISTTSIFPTFKHVYHYQSGKAKSISIAILFADFNTTIRTAFCDLHSLYVENLLSMEASTTGKIDVKLSFIEEFKGCL